MKIGITFFGSKLDLLCISKVLPIFCVFSKIQLKRKAPGDTWRTRRVPGVGGSRAGALGELPGGALGARPRGTRGGLGSIRGSSQRECPLDTRRTRRAPGCGLRVRHSGTGGVLGDIRRKSLAGYSGTGVAFGGCRGGVTRGARDALGSFREACGALGASGYYHSGTSRYTSGTSGGAGVVGTRGTWPSPKDSEEGSGEGFEGGTR